MSETTTDEATTETATPDDQATSDDAAGDDRAGEDGHHGPFRAFGADLAEQLADELDLDVDDVTAALDTIRDRSADEHAAEREARRAEFDAAREEQLAAAVEDGSLTQEQADLLTDLWAARDEAAEGLRPDDLTNEQRESLSAFRDAVGDEVPGLGGFGGRDGHHGRGGFGRGGGAPGDATEGAPGTPDATEEATVQESALVTT